MLSRFLVVPGTRLVLAGTALLLAPALSAAMVAGCGPKTTAVPAGAPAAEDAGDGGSADAAPPPRPFAASAAAATQLIGDAVETRSHEVQVCIDAYRARKKLPRERVSIQLGIDQEGRLLGVTLPKGQKDPELSDCVQKALADAPFPRSHTGVISVTKSYEEIAQ